LCFNSATFDWIVVLFTCFNIIINLDLGSCVVDVFGSVFDGINGGIWTGTMDGALFEQVLSDSIEIYK